MSDQCERCVARGDMKNCQFTECGHHETWYAQELLRELNAALDALRDADAGDWAKARAAASKALNMEEK